MDDNLNNKNNEELAKEYMRHIDIIKTNASILRQTATYLSKSADGLDQIADLYSNPMLMSLPGRKWKNRRITKSNECLYILSFK